MISEKQLEANRKNSKKSTGPRDMSKVRFNALKHGLRSDQVILCGESREEFDELSCGIIDFLNPQDSLEASLVDQIVFAFWRVRRCRRIDKTLVEENSDLKGVNRINLFGSGCMDKLTRYETRVLNQAIGAMKLLADFRDQSEKK